MLEMDNISDNYKKKHLKLIWRGQNKTKAKSFFIFFQRFEFEVP